MKKLLSSLATFTLIASSTATSVVACGSGYSTAQKEAKALANKTIYLNDTPTKYRTTTTKYEDKTAQQDASAIDNAITTDGYLTTTQIKDLSFDAKTILKTGTNTVAYDVKAPDGSTNSGTLSVVINHPATARTLQAATEANYLNNKTVTLNDTASATYEDTTAQQDASAIDVAVVTAKYLNATQVKDLSFDNTTKLTTGTNKAVAFNVKAPDGSTAQGTFNIVIDPGQKPFTPTTESPQDIANKLQGKTVKLDPTFWTEKNILNYQKKFDDELVNQKLLTADEAQYVQGTSFVVKAIKSYPNLTFKVEKNGVVADAKKMTIDVINPGYNVLNKMKNGHITLDYSVWKGRELKNSRKDFYELLLQEKIVTQAEAGYIEVNDSTVINAPKTYQVNFCYSEWAPPAYENIPIYVVNK